ncbi:hypothetical protein BJX65DRAFT_249493 [Aspergillus insuetus]
MGVHGVQHFTISTSAFKPSINMIPQGVGFFSLCSSVRSMSGDVDGGRFGRCFIYFNNVYITLDSPYMSTNLKAAVS